MQKRAVGVQFCRPFKDLKIAQQVPDHEPKHEDASDGHHDFLADRRGPEAGRPIVTWNGCECAHFYFSDASGGARTDSDPTFYYGCANKAPSRMQRRESEARFGARDGSGKQLQ
jgi:hypothetical protein